MSYDRRRIIRDMGTGGVGVIEVIGVVIPGGELLMFRERMRYRVGGRTWGEEIDGQRGDGGFGGRERKIPKRGRFNGWMDMMELRPTIFDIPWMGGVFWT